MDRLWTPWRFAYVSNADRPDQPCVFCRILSEDRDDSNFVLFRGKNAFVILNLYPYTSGHILIIARRHITFLQDATRAELAALFELARTAEHALRSEYRPDGFNLGFNLGRAAGAGVDQHLHMHVLPRWVGDSSFLSVVSETRVLPEELHQTHARLAPYFRNAAA